MNTEPTVMLDVRRLPWWKRHWVHLVAVGGLSLGIGAAISGPPPEPETVVVAGPRTTVTPEPEPAVTITAKADAVEVVPDDCLAALDAGEEFMGLTALMLSGPIAGMFDAASRFDLDGMDAQLDQFNEDSNDLINAQIVFLTAADGCRS